MMSRGFTDLTKLMEWMLRLMGVGGLSIRFVVRIGGVVCVGWEVD